MIQRTPARIEAHLSDHEQRSWQQLLSGAVKSPKELLRRLELPEEPWLAGAEQGHRLFQIRVPEPFLNRMEKGNPADPLLRQVLPLADEAGHAPGFVSDPLEESGAIATTGLIRKYRSRALLMVTGQCAINCRYCFRKRLFMRHNAEKAHDLAPAYEYVAHHPEITDVLLTGGDPLVLPTPALAAIPLTLLGLLAWQSQPAMANLAAGVLALVGGILLIQVMRPAEPSTSIETATPADPQDQQALQRGWDALAQLQADAASDAFQQVVDRQPDHFDALTGLFNARRMGQDSNGWIDIAHRLFAHPANDKGQAQQVVGCWQQFRQQPQQLQQLVVQ